MKTKMIGTLAIAGLIAMAVFVVTAAADVPANISASKSYRYNYYDTDFSTTDNVYARGSSVMNRSLIRVEGSI
ncbi:hypothetical protein C5S36_09905 [Candidatus Methanophagaceae archaeon]|nr:hypothetical protein C5S36_09905 [Methanophagales archaeon]